MRRAFVLFSLPLALTLAAGCGGGGKGSATPTSTIPMKTATIAATATATRTATPLADIREQDWSQQSVVKAYIASAGGQVDTASIIYADLTQDGVDDAVVPIASGGESGDIALFVFGYVDGSLKELLRQVHTSIRAAVSQGVLRTMESVYGPSDPHCCPSQVQTTTYRWNGSILVLDQQSTGPAPTP